MDGTIKLNRGIRKLTAIDMTVFYGFLLRLFVLVFVLIIATGWTDPYFISDDISYDDIARGYLLGARGLFDVQLFDSLAGGFLQPLWPWVMCLSTYIFRSIYAARVLNIVLSTMCIKEIYNLTLTISGNKKTSLLAARLFAFLPLSVIVCCFPIKDIFLTYAALYAFNTFVKFQKAEKIGVSRFVISAALLVGVYFTRGAVTELMLLFFAVAFISCFIRKRNYIGVISSILICLILFLLFKNSIIEAFDTKLEDYGDYAMMEGGSIVRMAGVSQLYKMPLAYFWATLQPAKLDFNYATNVTWWLNIMSYLNVSMYPIAVGNFLYIFAKKKNFYFWISSLVMYCAIIYLVLGVFRHYLFLLPVQIINYALFRERRKGNWLLIATGAGGMIILVTLKNMFGL